MSTGTIRIGLAILTAALCLLSSPLHAQLAAGSPAITTQAVDVILNGQKSGKVEAGQIVTVLGLKPETNEAVISFTFPGGLKLVGLVPQASLVKVDSAAAAAAASSTAPAPAPTPVLLDLTKPIAAIDVAELFKKDKMQARAQCMGKSMTVKGVIEKLEVERVDGATKEVAVLTLATGSGLPRIKVRMAPAIGNNEAYFRKYNRNLPYIWWGYTGRHLDLQMNGSNQLQGRGVDSGRSTTPWFIIFNTGESVSIECTCRGQYMDVEFDAGLVNGT